MKRSRSLSSLPESSGYKRRKPSAASSRFAPIPGPSRKRVSQGAAPAIAGAEAHASPTSDHSRKSGRLSDRAYLNWKEVFTQDHQQQQQQQQAAAAGKGTSSHPGVARPVAGKNQKSQTSRHTLNQADARQLIPEAGRSLASELDAAHDHFQRNLQDRLAFRTFDVAKRMRPADLLHRQIRVYWDGDDGWYLGSVHSHSPLTGTYHVKYADGTEDPEMYLAAERLSLLMHAGESFVGPSSRDLLAVADQLQAGAASKAVAVTELRDREEQQDREAEAAKLSRRAAELERHAQGLAAAEQQPASASLAAAPAAQLRSGMAEPSAPGFSGISKGQLESRNRSGAATAARPAAALHGQVVWALVKGWPLWPAVVLTEEQMEDALIPAAKGRLDKVPGQKPGAVPVTFFGTYELAWLPASSVKRFKEGLGSRAHLNNRKAVAAFRRGLSEVLDYFKEGELPVEMMPQHHDDPFADDDGEGDGSDGEPEIEPEGSFAAQHSGEPSVKVKLPLKLGSNLTVLSLGRIEFLHPAYHTAKNIWPVGFKAERVAATPASKGAAEPHLCLILANPDGSGPLFRVTPRGGQPVEADTASKAWAGLYAGNSKESARALGCSGAKQFGLAHPRVRKLLHKLSGATRCEAYADWEGEAPSIPPLSTEEQRTRAAAMVAMQRLPEGVTSIEMPQPAGVCHVCQTEDYTDDNPLLQCDGCRCLVHLECYGVEDLPQGQSWLCEICKLGLRQPPACALCPVVGPPLRPTSCGRWCHIICAQWLEETVIVKGVVYGLANINKAKFQLKCCLCHQQHGACIQCAGSSKCFQSFHRTCAQRAGLATTLHEPGSDYETSEPESDWEGRQAAAQGPAVRRRAQQSRSGAGTGAACGAMPAATAARAAAGAKQPRDATLQGVQASQEAAARHLGQEQGQEPDCSSANENAHSGKQEPRAAAAQAAPGEAKHARRSSRPGKGNLTAAAAAAAAVERSGSPAATSAAGQQPQAAGASGADSSAGAASGPGRAESGRHARRSSAAEGRADAPGRMSSAVLSEVLNTEAAAQDAAADLRAQAAARQEKRLQRKRRRKPFEEGTYIGHGYRMMCFCPKHTPAGAAARQQQVWRTAAAASTGSNADQAAADRFSVGHGALSHQPGPAAAEQGCARETPYNHALRRGQREPDAIAAALAKRRFVQATPYNVAALGRGGGRRQPQSWCHGSAPELLRSAAARPRGGPMHQVLTQTERFLQMQRTVHERLTSGKSAIHGWGAFAKRPHCKEDFMIEYAGAVVRHSIADLRERTLYNGMVGAGTYVFSLDELCVVDATRQGNLAHLLNHSCGSNCYSKHVMVWDESTSQQRPHVVICAKQDIAEGVELTYDYRFSGDDKLPCNCGAAECRGFVNKEHDVNSLLARLELAPLSKLKPLI